MRLKLLIILLLAAGHVVAGDSRICHERATRSQAVKAEFKRIHPCPVTGLSTGACPGWQVDHVIPLARCGCDKVENLQWLKNSIKTCAGTECKDRWERKINDFCPKGTP